MTSVVTDGNYNVVNNSTLLSLRFGNDGYLYLLDITAGNNFIIGRSNSPIIGTQVAISFGGENQPNAKLPVIQERTELWTIVHDRDLSENGEWRDGIEEETVLKSNMEIYPGQKVTMNFNFFGRFENIGFNYTLSSSNVPNAHDQIEGALFYNTAEALKAKQDGDWTWNTAATYYYNPNGDGSDVGYFLGNGVNLGLISWRYGTDNSLEMWHETNNELIATKDSSS